MTLPSENVNVFFASRWVDTACLELATVLHTSYNADMAKKGAVTLSSIVEAHSFADAAVQLVKSLQSFSCETAVNQVGENFLSQRFNPFLRLSCQIVY
jgi:hypothetical protein